jgi:predicted permease
VLPALLLLVLLFFMYLHFLLHLPMRSRVLFLLAGFIYFVGAVGVEVVSGLYAEQHGETGILYDLIITVEELLEMRC